MYDEKQKRNRVEVTLTSILNLRKNVKRSEHIGKINKLILIKRIHYHHKI